MKRLRIAILNGQIVFNIQTDILKKTSKSVNYNII